MRLCLHFDQLMTLHDDTARKNMQGQHIKSRRSIRNFETHLTSNKRVAFQSNNLLLRFPTFFKQQWKKHNDIVQQMTSEASFKQRQQLRSRRKAKLHLQFDLISQNNNMYYTLFCICYKKSYISKLLNIPHFQYILITQNVSLEFFNFGIFHQFLPY